MLLNMPEKFEVDRHACCMHIEAKKNDVGQSLSQIVTRSQVKICPRLY